MQRVACVEGDERACGWQWREKRGVWGGCGLDGNAGQGKLLPAPAPAHDCASIACIHTAAITVFRGR